VFHQLSTKRAEKLNFSRSPKWARKHYFILTTVPPFENRLNSSDVADWSSGQLHIARYRIKSYRNQIDVKGGWLDTCLSNEYAFPKHYEAQINREFRLPLSNVDEHNLGLIWKRLKQIDISRTEENRFLSISSLYDRLAERAQTQLLHLYNNEEISQFPEKDLYFLRNEIYARKGWTFSTPKLHKYFSRKGWYDPREDFSLRQLSPVEICNAFYLKGTLKNRYFRHPADSNPLIIQAPNLRKLYFSRCP